MSGPDELELALAQMLASVGLVVTPTQLSKLADAHAQLRSGLDALRVRLDGTDSAALELPADD